jgi:putative membrane protein insertion efficiency factor
MSRPSTWPSSGVVAFRSGSASVIARAILGALSIYKRLLSPLFAGSCRYLPSCSDYMSEAVARHGALAGVAMGLRRLGRCHPWGGSGLDPVPHAHPWKHGGDPVRGLRREH